MDYREEFIKELSVSLLNNFNSDDVKTILSIAIISLEKYEIMERTTEVAIRDNSFDNLLHLYAGTLLTEGKSKKTVHGYVNFLKRFNAEIDKPLLELNTFDIRVWLAKAQKTVSLRTCENYRSYLAAFYTWLLREEIIKNNPMDKIKPIKYTEEVKMPFSDVEIDILRMNCKKIRDRAILELLLSSGMRVSELSALTISDINFSDKSILIREAKGGKQRVVYISDVCLRYLKKYLDTRTDSFDCLFLSRNKTALTKDSIENTLKSLGKISGVNNVHPHRFRRTFATNLYKRGMDLRSIQKLMGHTNLNTTMIYISSNEDELNAEYRKCCA